MYIVVILIIPKLVLFDITNYQSFNFSTFPTEFQEFYIFMYGNLQTNKQKTYTNKNICKKEKKNLKKYRHLGTKSVIINKNICLRNNKN